MPNMDVAVLSYYLAYCAVVVVGALVLWYVWSK